MPTQAPDHGSDPSLAEPSDRHLALRLALRRERVGWVDYAKGICILLVVMMHATQDVQQARGAAGWLEHLVAFARPFRMPDFFLIAGLFLARTIDRPWRTFLDKKVLHFTYLYALWATLGYLLFFGRGALKEGQAWSQVVAGYPLIMVEPLGPLWFIHSLALYFLVVRLTRRVPWWLVLLLAAALQSMHVSTGWLVSDEFAGRFVYFYAGYCLAPQVFRAAAWAATHRNELLAYLLGWGLVNQHLVSTGYASLPGISLGLGFAGALAVVFLGVLMGQLPGTRALRYLGEQSIVVYLGYFVSLRLAAKASRGLIGDAGVAALALTFASILGALAMRWLFMRVGLTFFYRRPAWAHLGLNAASPGYQGKR